MRMTSAEAVSVDEPRSNPKGPRKFRRLFRRRRQNTAAVPHGPQQPQQQPAEERGDVTIRTAIMGSYEPAERKEGDGDVPVIQEKEQEEPNDADHDATCATAIFQQSIFLCGREDSIIDDDYGGGPHSNRFHRISEDPTVEESFECMVASQLEEGLPHDLIWEDPDDENDDDDGDVNLNLMSPTALLQSRSKSRLLSGTAASPLPKPKKTFRAGSLVHLGTYDPVEDRFTLSPIKRDTAVSTTESPTSTVGATVPSSIPQQQCRCQQGLRAPGLHPSKWPQRPLLLRPTPGSGTRVRGIRYVSSSEYLWKDGDSFTWIQKLHEDWGQLCEYHDFGCRECMILPINNGNEEKDKSLVVDFVSPAFQGTLLLRLRHSNGTTPQPYNDDRGYFAGMNRRYQVVIQGQPLRDIPLTECMTGTRLVRPAGKLPPKWIIKGAIKVLSFFAPQMQVVSEGQSPYYVTPLGSTPQVLKVNGDTEMEKKQAEPTVDDESVLGKASDGRTSLQRARVRKKLFDKLFVQGSKHPVLKQGNIYTFEFLQHLFNFNDFTVELGSMLGSVQLDNILDGQPMNIMAETSNDSLWSFDIWHECLMETAQRHDHHV